MARRLRSVLTDKPNLFDLVLSSPEISSLSGLGEKGGAMSFSGLSEAGKPFFLLTLALATNQSIVAIASSAKQQEHLFSELHALADLAPRNIEPLLFSECESFSRDKKTEILPDLEARASILSTLLKLDASKESVSLVIATERSLHQTVPSPQTLRNASLLLKIGDKLSMDSLADDLIRHGYELEAQVAGRGQFARRGGILDIFSFHDEWPVRVEFLGEEIVSMRSFDPHSQISISPLTETQWTPLFDQTDPKTKFAHLEDYLPTERWVWWEPLDPKDPVRIERISRKRRTAESSKAISIEIVAHEFLQNISLDPVLSEQRRSLVERHWKTWLTEGWRVAVCCNNQGEEQRLREWIGKDLAKRALWLKSPLLRGFSWHTLKLAVLSDAEIFGRYQTLRKERVRKNSSTIQIRRESIDFSLFKKEDLVVHVHHGIGRFLGVGKVETEGKPQEVLTLEYEGGSLLHVPIEQAHLVGRYVGVGKARPALDQLGGSRWSKATARAQRSIVDYAAVMLKTQAERQLRPGIAFSPDTPWQKEFENSFLYEETPDQITAIEETKIDMESTRPMDRLICGDVGFGKTEVAIRAAFKAVMSGRQVAVLAPTTVLAQQHERTFHERMADYPIRIDLLSRFRTKKQQLASLLAAREGSVDILIGTHRLLQPDVSFRNLGLVIVDEEQRFGVKHKESFKQLFKFVDMLTLSATPIPRTLYQALMGTRDMSTIETPPAHRLPIETIVAPYDERLIRAAIERELARGGQVYILHNRIHSIQRLRDRIRILVPKARVDIGHGRMEEDELEAVMLRFVKGETDVLVATTIIESGLDIPRANTILIDRADLFGLADLYQLRGRVGRSQTKAYAYLLLPPHLMMEADARRRVSAIRQYSELGAGFKVAMRDLEIRGAGNLLGFEQSGHASAIGFELYCQLLKQTLARLKGEKTSPRVEVKIRLDFLPMSEDHSMNNLGAFLPRNWMPESRQRIEGYRRLAEIGDENELKTLEKIWLDRFGKLPNPAHWLLDIARIRLQAARRGLESVEVETGKVLLRKRGKYLLHHGKFPRLKRSSSRLSGSDISRCLSELRDWIEILRE